MEWDLDHESEITSILPALMPYINSAKIVLLQGEMGSGKTTFVRYFNDFIQAETATSPTFSIVNEYSYPAGRFYHFDLYRLNNPEELEEIGFDEYLQSDNICLIEWPELGKDFYPETAILLEFIKTTATSRKLVLNTLQ